jgi:hypothetical protein
MSKSEFIVNGGELQVLDLSIRNKIELKLFGRSRFANVSLNKSWRGALEFYVFRCDKHGVVANYPHREEQVLECPVCLKLRYLDIASIAN